MNSTESQLKRITDKLQALLRDHALLKKKISDCRKPWTLAGKRPGATEEC